jgi:hypothetical protein
MTCVECGKHVDGTVGMGCCADCYAGFLGRPWFGLPNRTGFYLDRLVRLAVIGGVVALVVWWLV